MATKNRSTLRAVRLGQALRDLREDSGKTVRAVAADLGVQPGTLSKKENGKIVASTSDVDAYLRICHEHDRRRRDLLYKLAKDVFQKGWWDGYIDDVDGELIDRIWLESKAIQIDSFENVVIPGLLQTPAYASGLMRIDQPTTPDADIERWLEVRATRQHIINRHEPINFRAVIDQSVLVRHVVSPEVMRRQLDYLLKASKLDNVEIWILPFSSGIPPIQTGAFEALKLVDPYPSAGLLPGPGGDICVEGETIDFLVAKYDRLLKACLDPDASRQLITAERDKL